MLAALVASLVEADEEPAALEVRRSVVVLAQGVHLSLNIEYILHVFLNFALNPTKTDFLKNLKIVEYKGQALTFLLLMCHISHFGNEI